MIKEVLCGIGISTVLAAIAFVLTGYGHGTYWPLRAFFAPLAIFGPLEELLLSPLLYGLYAAALAAGKQRGWGGISFIGVLVLHYTSLILAIIFREEDLTYLAKTWHAMPWYFIAGGAVFV